MKKRIAIVVQRYGVEIVGGSETLARELAERLVRYYDVEVLTTCAKTHTTWANEYPQGAEKINGVLVRRFRNKQEREPFPTFNARSTLINELDWMDKQGPYSEALLLHLANRQEEYDCVIFITYLYFNTYYGIQLCPSKAILVPTAHDEPPIYMNMFNTVFHLPQGIIYLTAEEKEFVNTRFKRIKGEQRMIGMGVPGIANPPETDYLKNLERPYLLYVGRIEPAKDVHVLLDYFEHYKAVHPERKDLALYLAGSCELDLPRRSDIVYKGFVSEEEKARLIAGSIALVQCSKYESFSIATLEGMLYSVPVIVNAQCPVLKGHVLRSNAGLWYGNYAEFEGAVEFLLENGDVGKRMGANGREYVVGNYRWDDIAKGYAEFIEELFG